MTVTNLDVSLRFSRGCQDTLPGRPSYFGKSVFEESKAKSFSLLANRMFPGFWAVCSCLSRILPLGYSSTYLAWLAPRGFMVRLTELSFFAGALLTGVDTKLPSHLPSSLPRSSRG